MRKFLSLIAFVLSLALSVQAGAPLVAECPVRGVGSSSVVATSSTSYTQLTPVAGQVGFFVTLAADAGSDVYARGTYDVAKVTTTVSEFVFKPGVTQFVPCDYATEFYVMTTTITKNIGYIAVKQ